MSSHTTTTATTDRVPPTLYWGTGNLASFQGSNPSTTTDTAVLEALRLLEAHGISHIDTAQRYGGGKAEEILGRALRARAKAKANTSTQDTVSTSTSDNPFFTVDTKWAVPLDRPMIPSEITTSAEHSNVLLTSSNHDPSTTPSTTPAIDTFYLHSAPTADTDVPALLAAIDTLHRSQLFKHFGLSNFTAAQVREIHGLCVRHSRVLPTVYQGMYNAVFREPETDLLPTLRDLDVAFRAYSPMAGGFLSKTRADFEETKTSTSMSSKTNSSDSGSGSGSRFSGSSGSGTNLYRDTYVTPARLAALDRWASVAEREGVGRAELAYRWVVFHGALDGGKGDGVIVGARGAAQLEETLGWVQKGPLSVDAVEGVQGVWETLTARSDD